MRETSELLEMFYILAGGAQLGTVLASRGYVARSGDVLGCQAWAEGRVLLASSGWKSRMLLSMQPPSENPELSGQNAHGAKMS